MQPQSMSLIMEYVPHGNLFRTIQQDSKGMLQWWDRGRHVALDIAKGLAYLHSRKVLLTNTETQLAPSQPVISSTMWSHCDKIWHAGTSVWHGEMHA